jgi:hypothetical protein
LAPVLLAATSVATSDVSGAAEGCIVKPSGPAPQGQHWFYRFDREAKRPCWHLGAGVARIALQGARPKSAVDRSNSSAAEASAAPALPPQSQPAPAQETAAMPVATGGVPGPDSMGLEMRGWPTAVRFPDLPATKPLRLSDASEPAPAPAGSPAPAIAPDAAPPQAVARPARPAITGDGEGDHTFALIMVAMALLAIAGPVIHAARRRSDRKIAALCEAKPSRAARTVSAPAPASREVAVPEPLRQPAPPLSPPDRPEHHEQPEHRDQPKEGTGSKRVQPKSAKAEPKRVAPQESVQSKESAQSKSDQPKASVQSTDGDQRKASDQPKDSDQLKLGDQTDDLVEGLRRVVRDMVAKQAVSASAA